MTKQEVLNAANVMIAYANGNKVGTRPRRSMEPLLEILYVPTWNWEQMEYFTIPSNDEKEVSDTPRMKAAQMAAMEYMTGDVYRVGCDIERELNAANQRIKRLEEAGDAMLNAWLMPEDSMEYCDWIALSADAKAKWFKAKEAKP